jgi:hypothetical protein
MPNGMQATLRSEAAAGILLPGHIEPLNVPCVDGSEADDNDLKPCLLAVIT